MIIEADFLCAYIIGPFPCEVVMSNNVVNTCFHMEDFYSSTLEGILTTYHANAVRPDSTVVSSCLKQRGCLACFLPRIFHPWFAFSCVSFLCHWLSPHCRSSLYPRSTYFPEDISLAQTESLVGLQISSRQYPSSSTFGMCPFLSRGSKECGNVG